MENHRPNTAQSWIRQEKESKVQNTKQERTIIQKYIKGVENFDCLQKYVNFNKWCK